MFAAALVYRSRVLDGWRRPLLTARVHLLTLLNGAGCFLQSNKLCTAFVGVTKPSVVAAEQGQSSGPGDEGSLSSSLLLPGYCLDAQGFY